MNYLDKTCISYASIMGLKTDLNLKGNEYSTLGSLYYIGQLVWEVCHTNGLGARRLLSD